MDQQGEQQRRRQSPAFRAHALASYSHTSGSGVDAHGSERTVDAAGAIAHQFYARINESDALDPVFEKLWNAKVASRSLPRSHGGPVTCDSGGRRRSGLAIKQISYANLPPVRMASACVRGKVSVGTKTRMSSLNERSEP